jgi:hypothetical protein
MTAISFDFGKGLGELALGAGGQGHRRPCRGKSLRNRRT